MKVLELYAGTRSIGIAFENELHDVFSVEWDKDHPNIDMYADIGKLTAEDIVKKFGIPHVVWASPDCTRFSVARIGKNWISGTELPKNPETQAALNLLEHTVALILELKRLAAEQGIEMLYFIENPRGKMRKMACMQELPRYTVTYCQYGDTRMKPTDLWTNHPDPQFKPPCKNGAPCHVAAPRGSRTGTQGIKGKKDRSRIPADLCDHVVDICDRYFTERECEKC